MIHHKTLEANIVKHCNNRCVACNHGSPFVEPYTMPVEVLKRDLSALKPFFHSVEFWHLGGEPLLHPNIVEMLVASKESGVSDKTCVLTNGRLLKKMPEDFWNNLDALNMSVYQNLEPDVFPFAKEQCAKYGVEFMAGGQVVQSFYKLFGKKGQDPHDAWRRCPYKACCWTIHDGFLYLCPAGAFWPDRFMSLPHGTDGIKLEGVTEQALREYLYRPQPLEACKICDSFTVAIPWKQSSTEAEWIKDSTIE